MDQQVRVSVGPSQPIHSWVCVVVWLRTQRRGFSQCILSAPHVCRPKK